MINMLKFSILITLTTLFTAHAIDGLSEEDILKMQDYGFTIGTNNGLAKSSKTALAITQYLNPSVNLAFEAPSGWTITDTFEVSGLCIVVVTNPFRTASVTIIGWKENTVDEAKRHGPTNCFYDNWSSSKLSTYVPYLYWVYDTTLNNVRFAHNQVKDKDTSNTITHVRTRFSQSNTVYYHSMYYRTTITDFNANESNYNTNWNNLLFISVSSSTVAKTVAPIVGTQSQLALSKSFIQVNLQEQQAIKLQIFDIRGRMLKQLYSGNLEGKKEFELGRLTPPYIVNLKAKSSENKLVLPQR